MNQFTSISTITSPWIVRLEEEKEVEGSNYDSGWKAIKVDRQKVDNTK